jgi:RimJ/RimL family protein N-acetyltransferase
MDTYQGWSASALPALFDSLLEHAPTMPPQSGRVQLALLADEIVGDMSVKAGPALDLGINVNPAVHGRGYASEAVGAVTEWLIARGERVQISCLEENEATHKLAGKLGFELARTERVEIKGRMVEVWRYVKG